MCSGCVSVTGVDLDAYAAALIDVRFVDRLPPALRERVLLERSKRAHPASVYGDRRPHSPPVREPANATPA